MVSIKDCVLLERNPQYLTPKQMRALKKSIERDGFTVPILVRPRGDVLEIVSGNHRFMAAKELGYDQVPAVVANLSDDDCRRLAINLNLIHGTPLAEQLAPFLADCSDAVLRQIHLEGSLLDEVKAFDAQLAESLARLEAPDTSVNADSPTTETRPCKCPTCGKSHIRASM